MGAVHGYDVGISNKLGTNGEHTAFSVRGDSSGTPYTFQVTITRWPTGNCQEKQKRCAGRYEGVFQVIGPLAPPDNGGCA